MAATAAYSSNSTAASLRQFVFGLASFSAPAEPQSAQKAPTPINDALSFNADPIAAIAPLTVSDLMTARSGHSATSLADGRILIAGGDPSGTAEIYDPATYSFVSTGNLGTARSGHTATRLADGRVLIAGGSSGGSAVATTEIYDPATGTFGIGPSMAAARSGQTATTLGDGRIVVIGGDAAGSIEIYDASANSFASVAANLSSPRSDHSAALLQNGNILIVGGTAPDASAVHEGEIFNVADSSVSTVGNTTADGHTRALLRVLSDGKVQIIGGTDHGDMEIYDPADNRFGAHSHVFPIGDSHPELVQQILDSPTRTALFYHGASTTLLDRERQTITELSGSNKALVVGGTDSSGTALSSSSVLNSSPASITTDKLDYRPGTPVVVTGTGFQPNEVVTLMFHEDPHPATENPHTFTVTTDPNGNFVDQQYAPDDGDIGVAYVLAAVGGTSGLTAQTAFADGALKIKSAAWPGSGTPRTFGVTVQPFIGSTNCTIGGGTISPGTADINGLNTGNIGGSDSWLITANTNANAPNTGFIFFSWTTTGLTIAPGFSATDRIICIQGFQSGTIDLIGNYVGGTTTVVVSSANPSVFGQSVTFTATVTKAGSTLTPSGIVTFKDGASTIGTGTLSSSVATFSTSALSVGSHPITAVYGGDTNFAGSTSPVLTQVVNKANTTTTISSDHANPLAWTQILPSGTGPASTTCGQSTMADGNGRLVVYAQTNCNGSGTGQVWVLNGANGLGTASWSLVASGGPNRHAQVAVYDKVGNKLILFGGCTIACTPVANDVWVLTNANGQGGTAVWTQLSTTGGPPSARNGGAGAYDPVSNRLIIFGGQDGGGFVVGETFSDVWVLSNANITSGSHAWTQLSTSGTFPKGVYHPTAFYDSVNNRLTVAGGARSDTGTNSSAVNVLTNANGIGGTPVWTNLIAEGAAGAPVFAGWAADYNGATNRGILAQQSTSNLYYLNNANGLGGITSYSLITPSGGGGAVPGYGLGFDAPTARTMAWHQSGTNTSYVLVPASSSTYGDSVTFTANVTATAPGAGTPTGSVQFFDGATPLGSAQPISGGAASINTSALVVGVHNITAVYSGDANFTTSTSGLLPHTVIQAATATTVASTANPSTYGDSVTFTSTILSGVNPVTEGTVTFIEGGTCAAPGTVLQAAAALNGSGQVAYTTNTLTVPSHVITACYSGTNFATSTGAVTQTVNKATLTVTADPQTITYGDADPTFTFQYSGFVLSETSGVVDTPPTCTVSGPHTDAGSYPIVCSGGADNNYTFSYVNSTLAINKAHLSVTANNASREYGDANPTFAAIISGFKFSETSLTSGVTGAASCTTAAVANSPASPPTYAITCTVGTLSAANYDFPAGNFVAGALTITKAHLTVTGDNASREYGDANPTFTATITGFKNLETLATSGVNGSASCSSAATATSPASPPTYAITCTIGTLAAGNYDFPNFAAGALTITKAHLTVTGDNAAREYGDANPTFTATINGFKNGENLGTSGVTGGASCTSSAIPTSPVIGNPYSIVCVQNTLAAGNYDFPTFVNGVLTLTKAHLTVTGDSASREYGDANPSLTATISGFKNLETLATGGVLGSALCTSAATPTSSVAGSPYAITCTVGTLTADNYDFPTFMAGSLTVTKAHLTVTGDNAFREYGDPDPGFTGTVSAFKNGETLVTSGVTGLASCTSTAVANSPASPPTYPITCTVGTLVAGNYDFTNFVAGALTITKATLNVNAVASSKTYGASDPAFSYTLTGFKLGENSSVTSGAASCARTTGETVTGSPYTITCTAGTLTAASYNFVTGTTAGFTINKATLTVTPNPQTETYGTPDPVFTFSYSGFAFTDNASNLTTQASCSVPGSSPHSAAGSPYSISCVAGTADNYDFNVTATAVFTVNRAALQITASSHTVTYGDPAPTIAASYSGFVLGEGAVNLTTQPICSTTYTAGSPVSGSPYPTSCSGATSGNYDISYVAGTVTVNRASLQITASSHSLTFGDAAPTVTASYSGFVLGEGFANLPTQPTCSTTYTTGSPVSGSPYPTSCSGGASGNYDISYVNGNVTVAKAATTTVVTFEAGPYVYRGSAFTATAQVTGAGGLSETVAVVYSGDCLNVTVTDGCTATATYAESANHFGSSDVKSITILQAPVTATAGSGSNIYDGATHSPSACAVTGTYIGGLSCVNSPASVGPGVGTTVISPVASGPALSNFIVTPVDGSYTIDPAPVTATAGSGSGTYNGLTQSPSACVVSGAYVGGLTCANSPASVGPGIGTTTIIAITTGADLANFTVTPANGSYTIIPALVTATAGSGSNVYDGATHSPSACAVTGAYTGSLICANSPVSVGPGIGTTAIIPITTGADIANFEVTSVNGSYTIDPALVTATAGSGSNVYDGATHSPSACIVTGTYTGGLSCVNSPATVGPGIGTTVISPITTGADLANFIVTPANGSYTISPALVTATGGSGSGTYNGLTQSPLACVVSGDYIGGLTCANSPASVGPGIGTTEIIPITTGADLANFIVTSVNGSYTIDPASVTATAGSGSGTYNGLTQSPSACVVSGAYTGSLTCVNNPASAGPNIGTTAIAPVTSGPDFANFTVMPVNGSYTINSALVTATAGNGSSVYDGATHSPAVCAVTGTYIGGLSCVNSPASVGPGVGTTTITPVTSGADLANFTVTPVNGSYEIMRKSLIVTPNPQTITYGVADPTFTFAYTGFISGEGSGNLTTQASCSVPGPSPHSAALSPYTISCTAGTAANYSFNVTATAVLTVNKAPLTITASSPVIIFGSPVPTITSGYSGFVLGDTAASLTTPPTCTTTYTVGSLVGSYPSSCTGAVSGNYTFSYVGGNVTVTTACSVFNGFLPPIGGSVETGNGGSFMSPLRTFKLKSTIPIKFSATCFGVPLTTGTQTLQVFKQSGSTPTFDTPIDATPTDVATSGNQFRLTDTEWHYNLDTKNTPGMSEGIWVLRATLFDGSTYTVWISIKK